MKKWLLLLAVATAHASEIEGVVTSAKGPEAGVWVRGYGLVDSQKLRATPGKRLDLTAVVAPSAAAAAEYYPPIY